MYWLILIIFMDIYISKKTVGFTFIYSHLDKLMISFFIVECKSPMTDFVNSKMYSCPFCCCVNDYINVIVYIPILCPIEVCPSNMFCLIFHYYKYQYLGALDTFRH